MMKAKKKITWIWSILPVLVMLMGLLSTTALAAEPATADFENNPTAALTLLNAAKTEGAADSVWDSTTNTLTLNGVNFTTTAATAVKLPYGATIVLNGENTITGGNSASGYCYGIYAVGSLTIQGTGELTVTSGTATLGHSYGIYAYGNNFTIESGTVTATGGTAVYSYGIFANNDLTISDGTVTATGGTATNRDSFGIYAYAGSVSISGGTVTATGGEATNGSSYGIYTNYSAYVNITGGSLIAKAGSAPTAKALPWAPGTLPATYWWRSSDSGQYKNGSFNWGDVSTYVEIRDTEPITTYTVTFDANGGTDTMADVTGVLGDYTLPANGFTAPEGKQFKCWSVDGKEKAVGDKITVSADTTVKAVWEDIEYTVTVTDGTASVSKAAADTTVTLNANAAPSGQVFDKWEVVSGGITLADATSATTTFTMPANAVSVRATYKANPAASTYSIDLDVNAVYSFDAVTVGYAPIVAKTVTVRNTGTAATSALTVALSGRNANSFELNKTSIADISVSGSDTFTVVPKTGLSAGTYTATVTVSGDNSISASFNVRFTVKSAGGGSSGGGSSGGGSSSTPTHKVESEVSKDADGSVSFSKSNAKKGDAVTITVTPDRYYKVDSVTVKDKNGNVIDVTDNGDGTFTFKMPDSQVSVEPLFSWDNPFGDVSENAYYAPAVEWALKNDVTGGTTAATFSPNTGCTRAQIVTFLWRAAGCPEPADSKSFTDVSADAYYAKAVAWAAEQGITGGTGDGKFSPDAVCTRSQSMTFIYRSEQARGGGMQGEWMFLNPFADVNLEDYYGEAVMWAVANGVTDGTSDTTFSPNATCTRGQIVTFLYRFFVK